MCEQHELYKTCARTTETEMIRKPDQRARGNNKPTLGQSSRNNERLSVARPRPGALTILSCTLSALEEKGDEAGEVQREKFCSLIKKKLFICSKE